MAKITRYDGNFKAFGADATGTERTVFGSTTQTDDLTTNLGAEYQRGWGVLPSGQKPPKQYFNGALFGTSQAVAYLHQAGVAEWNGEQEYHAGSITNRNGQIFVCLTDDHVSAAAPETDSTNWRLDDGSVATISALLNRTTVGTVNVLNYHTGLGGGGGVFYWDASKPKAEHNGGTVIDPDKAFPTDWNNQTQLTAWFTAGSSGTGCWVRQYDGAVDVKWFGAKGDWNGTSGTDNTTMVQIAVRNSKNVTFGKKGVYLIAGSIGLDNGDSLYQQDLLKIESNGATLYISNNNEPAFTSQRWLDNFNTTGDWFTSKILFDSLIITGTDTSVFFDGDFLYNSFIKNCSIKGIGKVVLSSKNKGGLYPQGYIQSLYILDNNFANIANKIVDAKLSFNFTFSNNYCENCPYGIYIDGDGDPACNTFRVRDNLYEAGGVFIKTGSILGGSITGNYLEANTIGDAVSLKTNIMLERIGSGGYHGGLIIEGNTFQASYDQRTDPTYSAIRISNTLTDDIRPIIKSNYSNWYRLQNAGFSNLEGNKTPSFARENSGRSADYARISYFNKNQSFLLSEHLSAGVTTIAEIDYSVVVEKFTSTTANTTGIIDLTCLLLYSTSGMAVTGGSSVKLNLLFMAASQGQAPGSSINDFYLAASLVNFLPMPAGTPFSTATSGNGMREYFSNPAITLEKDAINKKYLIKMGTFTNFSMPNFGAVASIESSMTYEIKATNFGDSRTLFLT